VPVIYCTIRVFFRIIGIIVRVAPIGAFGAMAFTIGAYGLGRCGAWPSSLPRST